MLLCPGNWVTSVMRQATLRSEIDNSFGTRVVGDGFGLPIEGKLRLIHAISSIDRRQFVESAFGSRAHEDNALPIGHSQTISKPSTVAQMLAHALPGVGQKVLEVGVGCGYTVAVLRALGAHVCGIERIPHLARLARRRLDKLGFHDVLVRCGNGLNGWVEMGPFDIIIVSAALRSLPKTLLGQLTPAGKLVAPFQQGAEPENQSLILLERGSADGRTDAVHWTDLGPCQFVPAIGNSFQDRSQA